MKIKYIIALIAASLSGYAEDAAGLNEPVQKKYGEPATYREKVVGGLPIWPGIRIGGLHKVRSHEEIRTDLNIEPPPPPKPENVLKKWMTRVAVIAAVGGFIGLLAAAFLAYKNVAIWDDVGVFASICFSGGSLVAWKYDMIMWVGGGSAAIFMGYLIYNAYMKHKRHEENKKLHKTKESLVDSLDFVKNIHQWDDKAKILLDKHLQDFEVRDLIANTKATREEPRKDAIKAALAEWSEKSI